MFEYVCVMKEDERPASCRHMKSFFSDVWVSAEDCFSSGFYFHHQTFLSIVYYTDSFLVFKDFLSFFHELKRIS